MQHSSHCHSSSSSSAASDREINTQIFEQSIIEDLEEINVERISDDEIPQDLRECSVFSTYSRNSSCDKKPPKPLEFSFGKALFQELIEPSLHLEPSVNLSVNSCAWRL